MNSCTMSVSLLGFGVNEQTKGYYVGLLNMGLLWDLMFIRVQFQKAVLDSTDSTVPPMASLSLSREFSLSLLGCSCSILIQNIMQNKTKQIKNRWIRS